MLRRVVVLAALIGFVGSSLSAQTATPPAGSVRQALKASFSPARVPTPPAKPSFNVKPTRDAMAPVATRAPQNSAGKKSFWKSTWPYVILAGVGGGVYYAAKNLGGGDGSGY